MRTIFKAIVLVVGLLFGWRDVSAQYLPYDEELTVSFALPPVAILDIEPEMNNSLHFSVLPTSESGAAPQIADVNQQTLWLNYSSAIIDNPRSIQAKLEGGILPDGIALKVQASGYQGIGEGELGQPVGQVTLSEQNQTIIADVGNCYTGDGVGNGHLLSFSIEFSDFSQVHAMNETVVTVLYTITDN